MHHYLKQEKSFLKGALNKPRNVLNEAKRCKKEMSMAALYEATTSPIEAV